MSKPSVPAKSISLPKCPVFPTNVLFFNFFLWSKVMILLEETKMSTSDRTISTWTPLQHAPSSQKGPHSANSIRPPDPRKGTRFPTIMTSGACVMSSLSEETMMLTLVGAETTPRALTRARPGLCASVEWRRDARVLGPPPLRTLGSFSC